MQKSKKSIYICDILKIYHENSFFKIRGQHFEETEQMTGYLKKSRNRYINDALDHYNKMQRKRMLARQIEMESSLVEQDSMDLLAELEELEDESQAI